MTSKQLAGNLGIGERTILRAFADRDALVKVVVETFFVQTHETVTADLLKNRTRLHDTLLTLIRSTREFSHGVFRMVVLLDHDQGHDIIKHQDDRCLKGTVRKALSPYSAQPNLSPPERLDALIKLVVVAASAPRLSASVPLDDEEILDFIFYSIIGQAGDDCVRVLIRPATAHP